MYTARGLRLVVAAVMLWPAMVLADGADDLALTIEQNLAGIAFRLELRPSQAAHDLENQGRQIELLASEAPNHPALPELRGTYQQLQDELATALAGAAGDAASGEGAGQTPMPPEEFEAGMEEVETLQARAEAELFGGDPDQAGGYLKEAEMQLAALEQRYGDAIPKGHVPLLVAKEKLAALKDQLAERGARN